MMPASHNPRTPPKAPSQAAIAEIEHLLARGKARRAVERAKELHKVSASPESEALLVRAYRARGEEMVRQGHTQDAEALLALVNERYPGSASLCADLQARLASRSGAGLDCLARLALPDLTPAERESIEDLIRRHVADPRQVADFAGLPGDHPLRVQATAVARALAAVTSGPVTDADLALPEVPRQSPFAPWKLFMRAVARFYQRQDDECRRCLDALAPDSAPARLVPVLRGWLDGTSPRASGATQSLALAVGGDSPGLRKALADLDTSFRTGSLRAVESATAKAVQECRRCQPELLDRLRQHIAACALTVEIMDDALRTAMGATPVRDAYFWRLYARAEELVAERQGDKLPVFACAAWEEFRRHAIHQGWFAAKSPEEAAVYLRMAGLMTMLPWYECMDELAEIEDDYRDDGGMAIYYRKSEGQPHSVMACAPPRPPETYFFHPDEIFERACGAAPSPEACKRWFDWTRDNDLGPSAEEQVATAWHQYCPADPRPLLVLMERAEDRDALGKALKYLTAAEALDRMDPEVRRARSRLLVATALRHLRKKQFHLLDQDLVTLAELPQMREGDRPVLIAALRWAGAALQAFPTPGGADMADLVAAAGDRPTAILAADMVVRSAKVPGLTREAMGSVTQADLESALALRAVARVRELCLEFQVGFSLPLAWIEAMPAACQQGGASLTDAHLLSLLSFVLTCRRAGRGQTSSLGMAPLAYRLTACGLSRPETDQARFLLLRGRSLLIEDARAPQRGLDCLRAARALATRHHDLDLAEEATDTERRYRYLVASGDRFGDARVDPTRLMGAEEIQRVLATERNAASFPPPPIAGYGSAPAATARPPRRPRREAPDNQDFLPGFDLPPPNPLEREGRDEGIIPMPSTEDLEDGSTLDGDEEEEEDGFDPDLDVDDGADGYPDDGYGSIEDAIAGELLREMEAKTPPAMVAIIQKLLVKYGEQAIELMSKPKTLARKEPAIFLEMLRIAAEGEGLPGPDDVDPPPSRRGRKK